MWKKYHLCLSIEMCLIAFLLVCSAARRADAETADRIAPKILRFHVLANSNSPEDQALKLEVKDMLLAKISAGAAEKAAQLGKDALSKEELCEYISKNQDALRQSTEAFMAERGFCYPARLQLEKCAFPEKTYGDMTFPAGTYDAVRVLIGDGGGRNFWCVLYPSLCYLDSTRAIVPDESKDLLRKLIPEDDFQALMTARHPSFSRKTGEAGGKEKLPKVHVKFKLAELFSGR